MHECNRSDRFEECRLLTDLHRGSGNGLHRLDEVVLRDSLTVDRDTFTHIHEMRTGEFTHAVSALAKHGAHHRDRRSLAVGSRHVDRSELILGVSQRCQERSHSIEFEIAVLVVPNDPLSFHVR